VGWSCRRGWEEETSKVGWEVGILRVDLVLQGEDCYFIRSMVWKGRREVPTMSLDHRWRRCWWWFRLVLDREREEVSKLQELGNLVLWSKEA
jgi:hypothetical protein